MQPSATVRFSSLDASVETLSVVISAESCKESSRSRVSKELILSAFAWQMVRTRCTGVAAAMVVCHARSDYIHLALVMHVLMIFVLHSLCLVTICVGNIDRPVRFECSYGVMSRTVPLRIVPLMFVWRSASYRSVA